MIKKKNSNSKDLKSKVDYSKSKINYKGNNTGKRKSLYQLKENNLFFTTEILNLDNIIAQKVNK